MKAIRWLLTFALLGVPASAAAQEGTFELGMDAGFQVSMPDEGDNITFIALPFQFLRAGVFVTDRVELEALVSFRRVSDGDDSATDLLVFPAFTFHFADLGEAAAPYVRAGGGLERVSFGDDSETQFGVGGGVGLKIPVADFAFFRLEAFFDHWFEGDEFQSSSNVGGLLGMAFHVN